jgi:hypothetical protein
VQRDASLETRPVIDRANGIIVAFTGSDAETALMELVKQSHTNTKFATSQSRSSTMSVAATPYLTTHEHRTASGLGRARGTAPPLAARGAAVLGIERHVFASPPIRLFILLVARPLGISCGTALALHQLVVAPLTESGGHVERSGAVG